MPPIDEQTAMDFAIMTNSRKRRARAAIMAVLVVFGTGVLENAVAGADASPEGMVIRQVPRGRAVAGQILTEDEIAIAHARNTLLAHRIESTIEDLDPMDGSLDVVVNKSKRTEAAKLLHNEASRLQRRLWFGDADEASSRKWWCFDLSDLTVQQLLKRRAFGSKTGLGRFFRSKEISALTAKFPFIFRLQVAKRPYRRTPGRSAMGYDILVTMRDVPYKEDANKLHMGLYQILDNGRLLYCTGQGMSTAPDSLDAHYFPGPE